MQYYRVYYGPKDFTNENIISIDWLYSGAYNIAAHQLCNLQSYRTTFTKLLLF